MLKGKTTIELTDVNTGEKKVYEDHNMVTNFANYLFKNIGGLGRKERFYDSNSKNYDQSYYPYRTNMLGGLLLFDSKIDPKGGETIFAPTNASMVGCGAYNFTSTNNVRGSYNPNESYYNSQENTMKYVYDFSTNQANGTIKSVCLTSIQGGFGGYENPNNVKNDSSSNGQSFIARCDNYYSYQIPIGEKFLYAIDIDKNEFYYHNINSTTSIDIFTYDSGWYEKKILSSPYNKRLKNTENYTIDINSIAYTAGFYDEKHNTLHVIGHTSYDWANGVTLKVSKINLTDKTVENYTMTNDTGTKIQLFYRSSSEPKSWKLHAYVYDNIFYLWSSTYENYRIYKIDSTGVKETKVIYNNNNNNNSYPPVFSSFNGRILFFFTRSNSMSGYDVTTHVYNPDLDVYSISACNAGGLWSGYYAPSSGGTIVPVLGTNDLIKYHIACNTDKFWYSFITLNNYLATINNLETPITKTNTNTMKVIYTIQET